MEEIRRAGGQVFGLSVDSTWCHEAWRAHINLPWEIVLLSDFNREWGRAYGLLHDTASGFKDVLRRAMLVVDRDGKVRYVDVITDPPRLPTSAEAVAELKKL